jgi:ferredoxin, 2Fe-2S
MANITFISHTGSSQTVGISDGMSLMRGALSNGVSGITAECGGSAMCATCHVYIGPQWLHQIPLPNAVELEMLESVAAPLKTNSRLSCQIQISDRLNGMEVNLPEFQA